MIEIADGATEEEDKDALSRAAPRRDFEEAIEILAFEADDAERFDIRRLSHLSAESHVLLRASRVRRIMSC